MFLSPADLTALGTIFSLLKSLKFCPKNGIRTFPVAETSPRFVSDKPKRSLKPSFPPNKLKKNISSRPFSPSLDLNKSPTACAVSKAKVATPPLPKAPFGIKPLGVVLGIGPLGITGDLPVTMLLGPPDGRVEA